MSGNWGVYTPLLPPKKGAYRMRKSGATPSDIAYIRRREKDGINAEQIAVECNVKTEVVERFMKAEKADGKKRAKTESTTTADTEKEVQNELEFEVSDPEPTPEPANEKTPKPSSRRTRRTE